MEWGMYHGCKLVLMGNSPFLKRGRGFSEYILYWPGLWVVAGTHFQLSGCEWLTNLLCQMTKWPWSTCSCHNRDYFVIFPQQMEFVQTKGGFFPSHSNSQIKSGHSHAVFSPSAECPEPSPSTQTLLLCFHRVWSNPTVHWWHNGKAIPICDLWISSWNFVCLCLQLSKDQINKVVMGFVLFPWTKHSKAELSEGFWFRVLREGPVAHSNLSWNAEARDAVLGLNFWMLEWTMNCVFIFCWHVVS